MAPYKWLPIAMLTPLLYRSYWMVLLVPWFTVKMFDHYFERFFLWRYRNERVINLRGEFVGRLSKEKSTGGGMQIRCGGWRCSTRCGAS
jgi:hypothetical protein